MPTSLSSGLLNDDVQVHVKPLIGIPHSSVPFWKLTSLVCIARGRERKREWRTNFGSESSIRYLKAWGKKERKKQGAAKRHHFARTRHVRSGMYTYGVICQNGSISGHRSCISSDIMEEAIPAESSFCYSTPAAW